MKKTAGFTLVELIVVIAILAILAGIAIPVYSGYIEKANQASDMQLLDSIKTAAVFATVDADHEAVVDAIHVTSTNGASIVVKVGTATEATDVSDYIGDDAAFKYVYAADWTSDGGWDITSHK